MPVARPRLDQVTDAAVQAALAILGQSDLYRLLEAPATSATETLRGLTDRLYNEVRTAADKTDPKVNAKQTLVGHCRTVFASDAEREKYDNTLAWHRLDGIRQLAETAGGEGRIKAAVSDKLIEAGRKLHLSREDVVGVIEEVAAKKKWSVEVPTSPTTDLERCGACGEPGLPGQKSCPTCSTPFRLPCPKCGSANPSGARVCGNLACRFEVGNMPLAER